MMSILKITKEEILRKIFLILENIKKILKNGFIKLTNLNVALEIDKDYSYIREDKFYFCYLKNSNKKEDKNCLTNIHFMDILNSNKEFIKNKIVF